MKIGIRKPSVKKSISARTTGRVKRKLKRVTNPLYGKKGMGFVKNPGKAIKGKIYRKTTISAKKATKGLGGCLWTCFVLPFYLMWYAIKYIAIFMWYIMKYMAIGIAWAFVFIINIFIALVEFCINLFKKNSPEAQTLESEPIQTVPIIGSSDEENSNNG